MGDSMEFSNIFEEAMGALVRFLKNKIKGLLSSNFNLFQYPGRLKFSDSSVVFKNEKTGKLSTINASDLVRVFFLSITANRGSPPSTR